MNNESNVLLCPYFCLRCGTVLGAFELTDHVLERAQFIGGRCVCHECLTDKEKVNFLEDYIKFKEQL